MWRPWSRPLELLGRFRIIPGFGPKRVRVGEPGARDARGGLGWRDFLAGERLFDVWGPVPDGPWVPFHCIPLFVALDRVSRKEVGPAPPPRHGESAHGTATGGAAVPPRHARPGAPPPAWLSNETWTILDLPGPATVEAAVWLVTAGCQPVCTFDNWPHPKGLLKAERILAELLRWASTVAEARAGLTAASPPLWICDSERLGTRAGNPGEFDNRYFLDDSVLPGPNFLTRAGVRQVVYASAGAGEVPLLDLEAYFAELLRAGVPVFHVDLADRAAEPRPFAAPRRPRPPPRSGFRRSAAGGFGTEVPEPSSGGGGG